MSGAGEQDMRYRFDIVGRSVVDVVMAAGGWLYDRATAGWDVTVLIDDASKEQDTRPLEILGAKVLDLASVLTQWEHWPHPQTIAVCAEMFDGHAQVRQGVIDALEHSSTEVTLWGDECPADLSVDPVRHELSAAARAFKAQALAAVNHPEARGVGHTEAFRCGTMISRSVPADLIPAS